MGGGVSMTGFNGVGVTALGRCAYDLNLVPR